MQSNGTHYEVGPWTLERLLAAPEGQPLQEKLDLAEELLGQLEGARGQLTPNITTENFLAILDAYERLYAEGSRLTSYAALWFSENTQNPNALAFYGKLQAKVTEWQNRTLFFELWWRGLDDANAQRLLAAAGNRLYYLEYQRLLAKYTLAEGEEKIVNLKNATGRGGLETVYEMVTNKLEYRVTIDGEVKVCTREQLMTYTRSTNPDHRAAAYQELYRVYGENGLVLSQIYNSIARDWHDENVTVRGFSTPIAARNLVNHIPDEAVDLLLQLTRENAPVFHRWFALKAKYLGIEKLRRYDIYAPLTNVDAHYSYDDAVHKVLGSLQTFHPDLHAAAKSVFDNNHIHSTISPGKRGGAFCASPLPTLPPYVLVNYAERLEDVSTLAHELGHAIHAVLSGHHSILNYSPSLPLAETASVFSEMLLVDDLLADNPPADVRRYLIGRQLDGAFATALRQAYFAIWEVTAFKLILEGASTEDLCAAYLDNLREQFGPNVEIADEFKWEWVSIPHFIGVPFYVYAYAFGQLLVYALYQQYKEHGDAFKPGYLKLLAYGGAASPEQILTEAGIDMRSREFWQGGFNFIASLVDQLEALEAETA